MYLLKNWNEDNYGHENKNLLDCSSSKNVEVNGLHRKVNSIRSIKKTCEF